MTDRRKKHNSGPRWRKIFKIFKKKRGSKK